MNISDNYIGIFSYIMVGVKTRRCVIIINKIQLFIRLTMVQGHKKLMKAIMPDYFGTSW